MMALRVVSQRIGDRDMHDKPGASPAGSGDATQPIDMSKPHPFTEAGNREFNSFVWMPPKGSRAGEILLTDSTVFSTLFGADDSLKQFWKNLATANVIQHV